jgi:hypothetical protein
MSDETAAPVTARIASNNPRLALSQRLSLLLIGLGIGWLVGLSASPVVGSVIASLIGVAAGIVVTLQAIAPARAPSVDARPAALLVLGIALSASAGTLARTHHLLEPRAQRQLAAIDVSEESKTYAGALFRVPVDECAQLRGYWTRGERDLFVGEFRNSTIPRAKELASKVQNADILYLVVEAVCGGS